MAMYFSEIAKNAQRQGALSPNAFHDTFHAQQFIPRWRVLDTAQTSA